MGIDPVTAAIGSTIVSAGLGYKGAKDAKKAQKAQLKAQMEGFNLAKPFIEDTYSGGQDALNTALDTGVYQGQRYAGLDPYSLNALNYIYGFGSDNMGLPNQMMGDTSGFTQNYNDLYNQAVSGQTFNDAVAYANNPDIYQPLVDSALRDSRRTLTENVLPGINVSASNTGNTNSSRAGVAEALAQRAFDDRSADTTARIQDNLLTRSLNQSNTDLTNAYNIANSQSTAFQNALKNSGILAEYMNKAGLGYQQDLQNFINADMAGFNEARDFPLDAYIKYNSGILGNAQSQSPQNPTGVTASTLAGAIGGAQMGYGFGQQLPEMFPGMFGGGGGGSVSPNYYQIPSSYGSNFGSVTYEPISLGG
ncbi:MAG: hypothetical protein Unbinned1473contig1001_7 [Prokaryotic dsDNA virus sp.]|nr:MAG: hypothetical protein Unbinned1473contig1001_7 [Prokaryotic dsDNA virus sp.]|tara:strand:- start:2487 stop:3578 length:1092 start_codon:yes stop_codon:yes gene_type:complete